MSNSLISREALKKKIQEIVETEMPIDEKWAMGLRHSLKLIDNAPTVDIRNNGACENCVYFDRPTTLEPCKNCTLAYGSCFKEKEKVKDERPQGEWIGDTDLDNTCKCSECRMTFDTDRLKMVMCDGKYELPPCCPNCGAKMQKGGSE